MSLLGKSRFYVEEALKAGSLPELAQMRLRFLLRWDEGASLRTLGSEFGISAKTALAWQRRYERLMLENPLVALGQFAEPTPRHRPAMRVLEHENALKSDPSAASLGSVELARKLGMSDRTIRWLRARKRKGNG